MEARSLRFAATARALADAARRLGYQAPAFRSPPRVEGRMRTIRRHANGGTTISLVVRGRPWSAVVADMIDGFVVVNDDSDRTEALRDLLWAVIEDLADAEAAEAAQPRGVSAGRSAPTLQAVPSAAA